MKDPVFKRRMENLDELMEEIRKYCNNIERDMLQNIFENKKRRIRMCLQKNRGHFQMLA